jgi:DNA-damage-inducible protein J
MWLQCSRMKDSVIRARIDSNLKARASEVLASCGLEPSDAIRLFLQQVVLLGGIPFPVVGRFRSMKEEAQDRDREIAASQDLSGGEMLLIRPDEARGAKINWPSVKLSV